MNNPLLGCYSMICALVPYFTGSGTNEAHMFRSYSEYLFLIEFPDW